MNLLVSVKSTVVCTHFAKLTNNICLFQLKLKQRNREALNRWRFYLFINSKRNIIGIRERAIYSETYRISKKRRNVILAPGRERNSVYRRQQKLVWKFKHDGVPLKLLNKNRAKRQPFRIEIKQILSRQENAAREKEEFLCFGVKFMKTFNLRLCV